MLIEKTHSTEERSKLFVKDHTKILEMIATGEPASSIYDAIALMYEARHPGLRCSLLELVGNKLMHGGAPSLPEEYCAAVNGLENGPSVGSCGTSTFTGKRVLVENIDTDPKWAALKQVALPHGMRCCWSEPIINSKGKTLGAFGMYYNHPALPSEDESNDLESASRLASIIMDREQREAALRKSEHKYRTLVENLPQRFFMKDKESVYQSCSKNMADDFGIKPEEIVGTTDYDHYPKELAKYFRDEDQRIIRTGVAEEIEKDTFINNIKKTVYTIKTPILDEHGNTDGILGIDFDITEQKMLKEQFYQAQKMESVGTLVGGVAHEFNNTLAGILGRVYLATAQSVGKPEITRHLEIISTLSSRAAEMVQQLLTFSRKGSVKMEVFDLNAFIIETFRLHKFSIPENIKFETQFSNNELPILGDKTLIQQIFVNLLNNARDAVANTANPLISFNLELYCADTAFSQLHHNLDGQYFAHLSVEDNGCGLSDHDKQNIFDPFFTTKEIGKGTGLGLAMVYGATHTHHGIIDVVSELESGTAMHVYIPLSSEALQDKEQENNNYIHGKSETILLVDDEPELRTLGKEILTSLGYNALLASNGLGAVKTYSDNKDSISLVMMDVVMPKMGGVEAALKIRNLNENVKIIFCTGYDKDDVLNDISLKENLLISKPYNIKDLSIIIKKSISG